MSSTPFLNGYYPPPQQGSIYPSVHSTPRVPYAETEPWYHPNILDHRQLLQPTPLSFHWQPPVRARGAGPRPWRGGRSKERDRSSGSTSLFECKPCDKQYKSREAYTTHFQSHLKVHTVWMTVCWKKCRIHHKISVTIGCLYAVFKAPPEKKIP